MLKKEVVDLGYEVTEVENGRVTFIGDAEAICRANIFLRTAERVLLKVGSFKAVTFDELFEATRAIPWEKYLPKDGKCWVKKASSISSKLFSPSDIQKIMKKAIARHMQEYYDLDRMPETGNEYPLRVFFYKDQVTVGIDTSGESLHKRGYRQMTSKAPITETLAAALILLTPWKADRLLVDPFCGSGTFPIEAAMIGANIAPGMNRSFISEEWTHIIPKKEWYDAIDEAEDRERFDELLERCRIPRAPGRTVFNLDEALAGPDKSSNGKCEKCGGGPSCSFPETTVKPDEPPQEIWFYHNKSTIRKTTR